MTVGLYAPINNPNFLGRPTITTINPNGTSVTVPVATMQDLADMKSAWNDSVAQRIMELFFSNGQSTVTASGATGSTPLANRIAVGLMRLVPSTVDPLGSMNLVGSNLQSQMKFNGGGAVGTIFVSGFDRPTLTLRYTDCVGPWGVSGATVATCGQMVITMVQNGLLASLNTWTKSAWVHTLNAAAGSAERNALNMYLNGEITQAQLAALGYGNTAPTQGGSESGTYPANTLYGPYNNVVGQSQPIQVQCQPGSSSVLFYALGLG